MLVTIIARETHCNGTKRYRLSNGLFIDRDKYARQEWPYSVYWPGASPGGFALEVGGGRTLKDALQSAEKAKP